MSKFKDIWKTQKGIGEIYGKSAIAVGKALIQLGLRDEQLKAPTSQALATGIAKSTRMKDGTVFYLWQIEKTCARLNTLDGWQAQSQPDPQLQELSNEYISYVKSALEAGKNGEHHAIVDGYHDAAKSIAKKIKKGDEELIEKFNAIVKSKIPAAYLITIDR
jgi:hypothetical protein